MARMNTAILVLGSALMAGPAMAGKAAEALNGSTESVRRAAFQRTVEVSGEACPEVTKDVYMGEGAGMAFWTVDCGAADYLVSVSDDAELSSKVMPCAVAKAMSITCWKPF